MTIDERFIALTMNLELQGLESAKHDRQIEQLTKLIEIDAENIRALAQIAEAHETRLDRIDGGT